MAYRARLWYLPPRVSCLIIDGPTRDELRALAHGRGLVIDYFAHAARWGLRFGDVRFSWVEVDQALPDRALLLEDIDEPPTFIKADLVPLMQRESARLTVAGPSWLRFLRHPALRISNGGPWIEFFESRARPLGLRGSTLS